jgi:phospholipid/cholesterol/gamma-HCH transport system substrate-binding protein
MKVGILVTVALLLLAGVILQQSWGVNWFGSTTKAITYLPDVGGLKPGAPVWLAGLEIGKVVGVSIVPPEVFAGNKPVFQRIDEIHKQLETMDPKDANYEKLAGALQDELRNLKLELCFVEVQFQIRSQFINRISRDSEVSIESKGLIGDSYIDISPGTYGIPPQKAGAYYLIAGVRTTGFREIMTGANDVVANFGVLSDQFREIALKINADKVGSGLADTLSSVQAALNEAKDTFSQAKQTMAALRTGEGTVAKLISDPTAYQRLTEALEKFNKIASEIQDGSGTLSKLIHNPELFDNANETLKKADLMMERIKKGEGTLGRLSKDEALYERTNHAIEKFANFVDQIDKGQGTLGKLYKDPSLYNNLDQATAEITKLIYDLRQDPRKYLTIRFRLF